MIGATSLDYADETVREILQSVRTIAIVGASASETRPSHGVMRYLLAHGYRVVPVNPNEAGRTILGEICRADLASIPEPVDMVDIFRRSDAVAGIVEDVLALRPRPLVIWMQLGVRDDEAAARAGAEGLTVIMDRCPKIEHARLR